MCISGEKKIGGGAGHGQCTLSLPTDESRLLHDRIVSVTIDLGLKVFKEPKFPVDLNHGKNVGGSFLWVAVNAVTFLALSRRLS